MQRRTRRNAKNQVAFVKSVNDELNAIYDRETQEADSAIPSQQELIGEPYRATFQADIESSEETTLAPWQTELGMPRSRPYVLSVFDALPLNATQFQQTFTAAEQAAALGQAIASFSYVVPQGFMALVRQFEPSVYCTAIAAPPAVRDATTGAPGVELEMSVLIDGVAVNQLSALRVDDCVRTPTFFAPFSVPAYVVALPGQTITTRYEIGNPADFSFAFVGHKMSGQLLLRRGVDRDAEPATSYPLPVAQIPKCGC